MFVVFLAVNFLVALLISLGIVLLFYRPALNFLKRHFHEESLILWVRLIMIGIVVFAIGLGTRVWDLEELIAPTGHFGLTRDQVALEIYNTIVATMQVTAFLLFVLLAIVGIAVAIKRKSESSPNEESGGGK